MPLRYVVAKAELVYQIHDVFTVKGWGSVFIVDRDKLAAQIHVGDIIEFRGVDPPIRATIKSIGKIQGPPAPKIALGVMVSPYISLDAMKRNPQVFKASD